MREKKGKTNKANKYTTQSFLNDQKTRNPNTKKTKYNETKLELNLKIVCLFVVTFNTKHVKKLYSHWFIRIHYL